ncbi:MAG: GPR1/FUN34/YaaH family transporter [Firmicutes bacterium]|nr:GPR1/FUN34/YaaH family transporter [Bacillota bacterium]
MIKKVNLLPDHHVFGEPAPLGLLGLAISSFALAPILFGVGADKSGFLMVAVCAILFGGCCQLLSGLMDFANKNAFGGAVFTTFSFMWFKTGIEFYLLTKGLLLSHDISFILDVCLLVIFAVLTYGFGHFSTVLFLFLLDVDMIYVSKIVNHVFHTKVMVMPLAIFTILMGAIAVWITFATLINPVAGRPIFKSGPPLFKANKKSGFDFSIRYTIFKVLYEHWQENAFNMMSLSDLNSKLADAVSGMKLEPQLFYLMEYGSIAMDFSDEEKTKVKGIRLTASGIDLYEQLILKKYEF